MTKRTWDDTPIEDSWDPPNPMFDQPVLGLLCQALEQYHRRWGKDGPRQLRLPCRFLICSLAEDGDRALTRTEEQLLRQAVRRFIQRGRPELFEYLEAFL